MAYDPKKKRPSRDSLDAVVDEIFGEESAEPKKAKKASAKSASASKPKSKVTPIKKTSATSKEKAATKPASKKASTSTKSTTSSSSKAQKAAQSQEKHGIVDNVLPLYPESKEAPLIMQPQVWVATGIAALIVLFIARGRKKR